MALQINSALAINAQRAAVPILVLRVVPVTVPALSVLKAGGQPVEVECAGAALADDVLAMGTASTPGGVVLCSAFVSAPGRVTLNLAGASALAKVPAFGLNILLLGPAV